MALSIGTPAQSRDKRDAVWASVLALITMVCYANSVAGQFVFDDFGNIVANAQIRGSQHITEIVSSGLLNQASSNYYRPLPVLLWMAVFAGFGLEPVAFHVVNIAMHAASAAFVFLLALRVADTESRGPAVAAALLFALHPVNSEDVAWISGSVDVCATFFCSVALYAYTRPDAGRSRWTMISAGALFLALLSKEPALMVVPVLFAWDLLNRRDQVRTPVAALRAWAPAILVTMTYLGLRAWALGGLAPMEAYQRNAPLAAPILLGRYVELLLAPMKLSAIHEIPVDLPLPLADWLRTSGSLVALCSVACIAVRRSPRNALWLLLVVLPLVPVVYAQAMSRPVGNTNRFAERHLYMSTIGLALTVASAGAWFEAQRSKLRRVIAVSAVTVTVAYGVMTWSRNGAWHDAVTLWRDATLKYPGSAQAHLNLGTALLAESDPGASTELRRAVQLDRMILVPHIAEGLQSLDRNDNATALIRFTVVTSAVPDMPQAHFLRGIALQRMGHATDARAEFDAALRLDPANDDARRALAAVANDAR